MELNDFMHMAEESQLGKRTGKIIKGMSKSMDRMVR